MVPAIQATARSQLAPAGRRPARQGDQLKMALQSSDRVIERRWVYVLDIDCHGKGSLVYPLDYAENQFPNDADNGRQFVLPGARTLRVGPPYGVDTLILLSTAQPLPDPYALNFEGVATRGRRGVDRPLKSCWPTPAAEPAAFPARFPPTGVSRSQPCAVFRRRQRNEIA